MALKVGELFALITADDGPFRSSMDKIGNSLKEAGQKMTAIGQDISLKMTAPIIAAGAASFKLASDFNESLNKVDVAFKSNSQEVKNWAKNSLNSFGIAQGTALNMAALFGDMGTSMGLSTSQASKMSTSLVGLAGDLASFKNIGIEQATTALNSIFTGETESLKMLGVVMTEGNLKQFAFSKGIRKNIDDMTEAEKINLRYAFVMNATKNAQGDFARTNEGSANQMRIFQESVKELGVSFGQILLPPITDLIKQVNQLVAKFIALPNEVKKNILLFAGIAAAIGPAIFIIGQLITSVGAIATGMSALSGVFAALTGPIGLTILGIVALTAGIITLYKKNEDFRNLVNNVWKSIKDTVTSITSQMLGILKSSFVGLEKDFNATFGGIKETIKKILEIIVSIFKDGLSIVKNFWDTWGKDIFKNVSDIFAKIVNWIMYVFNGLIKPTFDKALAWIKQIWDENLKGLVEQLIGFVGRIGTIVTGIYKNFISPIVDWLLKFLVPIFKQAFAMVVDVVGIAINTVVSVIKNVLKILNGILDFLVGVFTGDWAKAWSGIKDVFVGLWDGIISILRGAVAIVLTIGINIVKGLWEGISSMASWIKKKVTEFVSSVGQTIKDFFGIASPSKLTTEYGKNIAQGLAKGIEENTQKAVDAANELSQKTISQLNRMYDATISALKKRNAKAEELELRANEKSIARAKSEAEQKIRLYEKEYQAKLKTLNDDELKQVGGLNQKIKELQDLTKAEEKALAEQAYNDKLAKKKLQIDAEQDGERKAELIAELNGMIADHERDLLLEKRQLQIDAYEKEIKLIQDNFDKKREEAEKELEYKRQWANTELQMQLDHFEDQANALKRHYEALNSEEALQAEARRLALSEDNTELVKLLNDFAPDWQQAGKTFGEQLLEGLRGQKPSIQAEVNDILSMVNQAKAAQNEIIIEARKLWNAANKVGDKATMDKAHGMAEAARAAGGTIQNTPIPKLAKGGIINKPTLAMVGEGVESEAVTPISKLQSMISRAVESAGNFSANNNMINSLSSAIGSAVLQAMQVSGQNKVGNEQINITLLMDSTPVARILYPKLENEKSRIGASAIIGGV